MVEYSVNSADPFWVLVNQNDRFKASHPLSNFLQIHCRNQNVSSLSNSDPED